MADPTIAPLYVSRAVVNAAEIVEWAKGQGFATTLEVGDLHVTIAYSRAAVTWPEAEGDTLIVPADAGRVMKAFGEKGEAIVLAFASEPLARRWQAIREVGGTWDHASYSPHITISYAGDGIDLEKVQPYGGAIVLGPERHEPINEDWKAGVVEKAQTTIAKVDESLGLVFGWAIVCKDDGVDHFDTQGDHIPEAVMLKAASEFMGEVERTGADMHVWADDGTPIRTGSVVFAWPMTTEIAKAMGFSGKNTGLMIAYKPDDPALLKRFKDGVYTGFSIGGSATKVAVQ